MINIVYVFDKNYINLFSVSAYSLLKNTATPKNIHIYGLCCDIENNDELNKIKNICDDFGAKITFIDVNIPELSNFKLTGVLTSAAYVRIYIADLIPNIDRCIYIDCDTIILGDINDLWEIDLENCTLGGAFDIGAGTYYSSVHPNFEQSEGFNSGVILLDLAKFRSENIIDSILNIYSNLDKSLLKFSDQDILNLYFHKDFKILPPEWNVFHCTPNDNITNEKELETIKLIHYISYVKPFDGSINNDLGTYQKYLDEYTNHKKAIKKWKTVETPILEITTNILKKGCVVNCDYCPQSLLTSVYSNNEMMSLDDYKKFIDKVPAEIKIVFSGFSEPWLNKEATNMLLYAHEKGHDINVYTTGVGWKLEDIELIKDLLYPSKYNYGFILHIPDKNSHAKQPMTERYIKVLERFSQLQNHINNFRVVSMGEPHEEMKKLFNNIEILELVSRANNLHREEKLKPILEGLRNDYRTVNNETGDYTCGIKYELLYRQVLIPDGRLSLCCMDFGLDHILGNLHDQDYDDIIPEPYSTFNLCRSCSRSALPSALK